MPRRKGRKRIPYGYETRYYKYAGGKKKYQEECKEYECHDCGVSFGKLHDSDVQMICDVEECPICYGQLLSCGHGHLVIPGYSKGKSERDVIREGESLRTPAQQTIDSLRKRFREGAL